MYKEVVVAYFDVASWYKSAGTDKIHKNSQPV
jgi:hypothetical protein